MRIKRNGKDYVLTAEELYAAHKEFEQNWMRNVLETDFSVPHSISWQLAEKAYEIYCEGDGKTSYECIESAVDSHRNLTRKYDTGDGNTGNRNTGDCNTGNRNTGDCNTGDWNAGDCNTGNRNTGDRNTGDWNRSSFNTGCFNTEEQKVLLFNKPSDMTYRDWLDSDARCLLNQIPNNVVKWINSENMTDEEKAEHPTYETTGGYLKVLDESDCGQLWWDSLPDRQKNIIKALPNFDPEIFYQCTGIRTDG